MHEKIIFNIDPHMRGAAAGGIKEHQIAEAKFMALHPDALVVLPGSGPGQLHADRALIDARSESGAIRPVIAVVAIVKALREI